MLPYIAELVGTAFLVILGDGVCCNVNLDKSGMKGAGVVHILIGWGMAVMVPAFTFGAASGAHFNPAVTIGVAIRGGMDWGMVPGYIIAQMVGGFIGAAVLLVLYHDHIAEQPDDDTIRGCFATGPSIRNPVMNFLSEFFATFILVFTLAAIPANCGDSGVSWVLVYGVIVACGASFGGLTGYAMNAARDSAPRLAYQLLAPNKGAKNPDWAYGWIPLIAPIVGGVVASFAYMAIFSIA
ncbi:MAG: aquaporin family protein [Atopobiaceae bacterium]|nr:aquaporin family protein [Atopobiaceae bacterium]